MGAFLIFRGFDLFVPLGLDVHSANVYILFNLNMFEQDLPIPFDSAAHWLL